MGASPTPMAFGEVYTSLQTGVIDGYEHDASTTLQQRFYEVAHYMARTRHIAGVLGLCASTVGLARLPAEIRARRSNGPALEAARQQRAMGPRGGRRAHDRAAAARHDHPRDRRRRFPARRRAALGSEGARARRRPPGSRRSARERRDAGRRRSRADRALHWSIALLVVAQAAVVGLQVVGRHVLHQPIPWTEEIARLLLVWLMCVGGIAALRHGQHPRVTALGAPVLGHSRQAVDRGLRLVLLGFFLGLVVPAWRLTVASAGERLPASGLSGAAISVVLPVVARC